MTYTADDPMGKAILDLLAALEDMPLGALHAAQRSIFDAAKDDSADTPWQSALSRIMAGIVYRRTDEPENDLHDLLDDWDEE